MVLRHYREIEEKTHRLVPSRYPPVSLFDWADSVDELEQIALLEGLTNDRLIAASLSICLVSKDDWILGPGSTPLMAAFTHPGVSRFSDGRYGVYYAAHSLKTAIAETRFHRELFLSASNEPPCLIQMREYVTHVKHLLVDLYKPAYQAYLAPTLASYAVSQAFAAELRDQGEWGVAYPSVRDAGGSCIGVFRPPALSIPVQAGHYDYIWDGAGISEVRKSIII